MRLLRRFLNDESGATAIEYGLIGSLIAVAIIAVIRTMGSRTAAKFTAIANNLT